MAATIIGIDAHKRSHTAVVLDAHDEIHDQLRLAADRQQLARLLAPGPTGGPTGSGRSRTSVGWAGCSANNWLGQAKPSWTSRPR